MDARLVNTEASLFFFSVNQDVIQSQNMPIVHPGWTKIVGKYWPDPLSAPRVPYFDDGVPALPAGVSAEHPQVREYYSYVEKLAPFYPAAIVLLLLRSLKENVGNDAEFQKYKGIIDAGLAEGDFKVERDLLRA